jgi:hypothetical protein
LAAGAGGVALQNARGVVLELHGVKVGVELSAAAGGVTITMQWRAWFDKTWRLGEFKESK